jgi:hypothetical protein
VANLLEQFQKSQGLLGAVDAIVHRRGFMALYGTLALTLVLGISISTGVIRLIYSGHYNLGIIGGCVGFLAVALVFVIGTSATGFLINDSVHGREPKTIGQALLFAVAVLPRILGMALVILLLGVLIYVLAWLAIFMCRLPGIGALLYVVVFPACTLLFGLAWFASIFVCSLCGPAIWEGYEVLRVVSVMGAIVRQRLFAVVTQIVLLSMLVFLVSMLIFGFLGFGVSATTDVSYAQLSAGVDLRDMMGTLQSLMSPDSKAGSYLVAGGFGLLLLGGAAITAPMLVAMAGRCIIFANVTENLSTDEYDQKLRGVVEVSRQRTEAARRQLDEARFQLSNKPSFVAPDAPLEADAKTAAAPVAQCCPHCGAAQEVGDVFCGECGQRTD